MTVVALGRGLSWSLSDRTRFHNRNRRRLGYVSSVGGGRQSWSWAVPCSVPLGLALRLLWDAHGQESELHNVDSRRDGLSESRASSGLVDSRFLKLTDRPADGILALRARRYPVLRYEPCEHAPLALTGWRGSMHRSPSCGLSGAPSRYSTTAVQEFHKLSIRVRFSVSVLAGTSLGRLDCLISSSIVSSILTPAST